MLISTVVPTYNRAEMIGNTIRSILNQTYKNIEIIVIDDGSTDNTEGIVKACRENPIMPIYYYKKENGGCASARNVGIRLAKGDFIAFLDSDDQWIPTAIETMLSSITESGADFVYSPSIEVFENGVEVMQLPAAPDRPEQFAIEHFRTINARPGAILYKKRIFAFVNKFDEELKYNEDSDFLQKVAINFRAAYSPHPTVKVFYHSGGKSRDRVSIYRAVLKSTENILREYPDFAKSLGSLAGDRLEDIKRSLLNELIRVNNLEECAEVAKSIKGRLPFLTKLSLFLKTRMLLR